MKLRLFAPLCFMIVVAIMVQFLAPSPPSRAVAVSVPSTLTASTVTGVVLLPNEEPAVHALVTIAPRNAQGQIDYSNLRYTRTAADGSFSFSNVSAATYNLEIEPYAAAALWLRGQQFTVSNPPGLINLGVFTLPAAPKQIRGLITSQGTPLAGVPLYAYKRSSWNIVYGETNGTGGFILGVDGGEWIVGVSQVADAPWMFTGQPQVLRFAENSLSETATVDLSVTATNGFFTGRVLTPEGSPLPISGGGAVNYAAYVVAWNDANDSYNYSYLSASGTFTVPVVAGGYALAVMLDSDVYPNYASPPELKRRVGPSTVALGDIRLLSRNATITGIVRDSQNTPVVGAEVYAYAANNGYAYAFTDSEGRYSLRVAAGSWRVDVFPPTEGDYLDSDYTQVITASENLTTTQDFALELAAAQITGTLVDAQNTPLTDVSGWAYARRTDSLAYVGFSPIAAGEFRLNVPAGDLRVGVILAAGSSYSFFDEVMPALAAQNLTLDRASSGAMALREQAPYEQAVSVPSSAPHPATVVKPVTIALAHNDARISGTLRDQQGAPLTGIAGVVFAAPASNRSAWQWADIDPANGSFELDVAAGSWYLDYYLSSTDQYAASPRDPLLISTTSGQTTTQDLTAPRLDGVIAGQVVDENGQPLADANVWVRGLAIDEYTSTNSNGEFQIYVPLNNGSTPAQYTIGTALSCAADDTCFINADPLTVTAAPRSQLQAAGPQSVSVLRVERNGTTVTLSGRVSNRGAPVQGARVEIAPEPRGSYSPGSDATGANGEYSVQVTVRPSDTKLTYQVSATFVDAQRRIQQITPSPFRAVSDLPTRFSRATQDIGPSSMLQAPDVALQDVGQFPQPQSQTFAVSQGVSLTLSDGMQIQIPANAVPTSESTARIVVEPTLDLPTTGTYERATLYGYSISLFEGSSGRLIMQPLRAPALLTLRYDQRHLELRGTNEAQIQAASFVTDDWQVALNTVPQPDTNKISVQMRTLGTWALVRPRVADLQEYFYLPLVLRR